MPRASLQTGLRGVATLVAVGAVALAVALPLTAGPASATPPRTAQQLLADLADVAVPGYSGTVVYKSTLLDGTGTAADDTSGFSLATLMSGTHTIRVWSAGPSHQRIAVLNATGESDLYRSDDDLWQWDSNSHTATFQSVSASASSAVSQIPVPVDGTTVTPDSLARATVAAIDPETAVSVVAPSSVAGRAVYRLSLRPAADDGTRIGQVVLSLDAETRMPLAAQVYSRTESDVPDIDISFNRIAFEVPDGSAFRFTPPDTATVSTFDSRAADLAASADPLLGVLSTRTAGVGWTRVAVISLPNAAPATVDATQRQFGRTLTEVSGTWGKGALLVTDLLTMLFADDGRIVVGAVDPSALYAAL